MGLKHKLKGLVREAYARFLYHTGAHLLVDRLMPRRMTILFGHCVDSPQCNGFLPRDMKIRAENLERVLSELGRHFELTNIREGWKRLSDGGTSRRSIVALSVDDGYRDNATDLLGILKQHGASATVFLETGAMDGEPINWSHKYHWMLHRRPVEELLAEIAARTEDQATGAALRELLAGGRDRLAYQAKRILKYEADEAERDRVLDQMFRDAGGDQEALRRQLYLSWDEVRALAREGIELGGHTIHHTILSRLSPAEQAAQIEGSRRAIEAQLGPGTVTTFAYPFGRRWDYNRDSVDATRAAGYGIAVNTHAGTVGRGSSNYELKRLPVDDTSQMHLLVAEACGGFDLLRRVGLDLSE